MGVLSTTAGVLALGSAVLVLAFVLVLSVELLRDLIEEVKDAEGSSTGARKAVENGG